MSELRTTSLIQTLVRRGESISCAESITGGLLASQLITPTGASEVMAGGIVAYATESKIDILGVQAKTIEAHGTVSSQTALEMAHRVRALFETSWGISTTGVAGPGTHEGHEAGTVFIALVGPGDGETTERVEKHLVPGSRNEVRASSAKLAIEMLALALD